MLGEPARSLAPDPAAAHVAFFGHNAGDAAVRRRASAFRRAGCTVTGFMPRRGEIPAPDWTLVDLGETHDNDYLHRIGSIFSGARVAAQHSELLRQADVIYARNLDMLALAARTRKLLKLRTPLVYECLDIHHRLIGGSAVARTLRHLEARLLRDCSLVVVSSPRFVSEHFDVFYPDLCPSFLVENRLIQGDAFGPRPRPAAKAPGRKLRIGWFGNLRCKRSLALMRALAQRFPDQVEIILRGYPAPGVFPNFDQDISGLANLRFEGRYKAPEDLGRIYGEIDLIWAGDWYEAGANSTWLLPNRIYEGGYFATPALAPDGTETARWLTARGAGLIIEAPEEESLPRKIAELLDDPSPIAVCRNQLLALPREVFVEDAATTRGILTAVGR